MEINTLPIGFQKGQREMLKRASRAIELHLPFLFLYLDFTNTCGARVWQSRFTRYMNEAAFIHKCDHAVQYSRLRRRKGVNEVSKLVRK